MGRISTYRQRLKRTISKIKCASFLALLVSLNPYAFANTLQESDQSRYLEPALGINLDFGRWDGAVNLVYDPDGAPEQFADPDEMLVLIAEAAGEWELVSGIRFNVTGIDNKARDDINFPREQKDGLVRIYWENLGGSGGIAGPSFDNYDEDKGYFPYRDGTVRLNDNPEIWDSSFELVDTMVHEFGHLIGLGHSDNPDSVMFANPYNSVVHPRADDIRAVRALYGNGEDLIENINEPVSTWVYVPLPAAPAGDTEFLFKPNSIFNTGSFLELNDNGLPATEINDQTEGTGFAFFSYGLGPSSADINIEATIFFVDPFGYVSSLGNIELACQANFSCGKSIGISSLDDIKTMPGIWKVFIIDDEKQTTLLESSFLVNTTPSFNAPPTADIQIQGSANNTIQVSLTVSDPDSSEVNVIWHPQGSREDRDDDGFLDNNITDTVQSGGTISREISFLGSEQQTLYVELSDNTARYEGSISNSSSAGRGFQTLVAIQVDLPVVSAADFTIVSNFDGVGDNSGSSGSGSADAVIDAIAEQNELQSVTTSDGSSTSAEFAAGASADSGSSSASTFANNEDIIIAGAVSPQSADVGQEGEIYVVLFSDKLTYLDVDGNFVRWNGSLKTIQPAFELSALSSTERFEVFSGSVQSGTYRVFLGYKLAGGGPLHFSAKAFRVNVE